MISEKSLIRTLKFFGQIDACEFVINNKGCWSRELTYTRESFMQLFFDYSMAGAYISEAYAYKGYCVLFVEFENEFKVETNMTPDVASIILETMKDKVEDDKSEYERHFGHLRVQLANIYKEEGINENIFAEEEV